MTRIPAELSVGFEEIDGQHRHLLKNLADCVGALEAGDVAVLRAALEGTGDAFVAHFAAEESYMEEAGYPDRKKHKAAHDLFMQDFAQLSRELETFGLTPLVQHWVSSRLVEWTRFHIQVNDVPLGRFLSSRRFRPALVAAADKPRVS